MRDHGPQQRRASASAAASERDQKTAERAAVAAEERAHVAKLALKKAKKEAKRARKIARRARKAAEAARKAFTKATAQVEEVAAGRATTRRAPRRRTAEEAGTGATSDAVPQAKVARPKKRVITPRKAAAKKTASIKTARPTAAAVTRSNRGPGPRAVRRPRKVASADLEAASVTPAVEGVDDPDTFVMDPSDIR